MAKRKTRKKKVELVACDSCKHFKPGLKDADTICATCEGSGKVEK